MMATDAQQAPPAGSRCECQEWTRVGHPFWAYWPDQDSYPGGHHPDCPGYCPPPLSAIRESLGRQVRKVWLAWANEQPSPKSSWLLSWESLSDADREVDCRIGEALASIGARHQGHVNAGLARLAALHEEELEGDDLFSLLATYRDWVNQVEARNQSLSEDIHDLRGKLEQAAAEVKALLSDQDERMARLVHEHRTMADTLSRAQKQGWDLLERARAAEQSRDRLLEELSRITPPWAPSSPIDDE